MIEFGRNRRREVDLDLTPMIDVVFQLLVFFLLTSALMGQVIPVNLPGAATGEQTPRVITLTIDADRVHYIDGERVARGALPAALASIARAAGDAELRAAVAADARIPHGVVIDAVDTLRQQGIDRIAFQVQPRGR